MIPRSKRLRALATVGLITFVFPATALRVGNVSVAHAATTQTTVALQLAGMTVPSAGALGSSDNGVADQEIDDVQNGDDDADSNGFGGVDRSIAKGVPATAPSARAGQKAKSNPELGVNFDGLNFHDQRYANGANQFSVEPPDQGLCVGNGYVVESTNDVFRVFDKAGNPLTNVVDLNTFYGYAPAVVRSGPNVGQQGPTVTDPVCYYDPDTQRFFQTVLTLDHVGRTASLNGNDHIDIAVSNTSNPTGTWTVYRLPVQNNGTAGTPDHHCSLGYCLGDYPHVGADANGIYITTNEFSTLGPGFYGVNLYAISKQALVAGAGAPAAVLISTDDGSLAGIPAFTVWPATSPAGSYRTDDGGTEFFMSSLAVFSDNGTSNQIGVFSLTNTGSLNATTPSLTLSGKVITTEPYGVPGYAKQKAGPQPLASCLADTSTNCWATKAGPNAARYAVYHASAYSGLNSNDSRMQQVTYANGKLWGALDTGLMFNNDSSNVRSGIAYFIINPMSNGARDVVKQGYLGAPDTSLTYPAIGVTSSGRGVIGFTVVGDNDYPSAGYAGLDAIVGASDFHIAATGKGPQDGFTQYRAFSTRPRWGDYGAAAVDGNSVWVASEYVAQSCDYAAWSADITCGGTRGALGNYSTHISQVTP